MIATARVTALALAVSIALGHASAVAASDQSSKLTPSSKRAIIGGDANAIIGGDVDAIIGGDRQKSKRAIIGGDVDAIIGGDIDAMLAKGIIAYGPIDAIDSTKGVVSVLGQRFKLEGTAAQAKALQSRLGSGNPVSVVITGSRDGVGSLKARAMAISDTEYVPGATSVMVVGRIAAADVRIGTVVVGDLRVDYSAALSAGTVEFVTGQTVAVIGVQSGRGMPLIASSIRGL